MAAVLPAGDLPAAEEAASDNEAVFGPCSEAADCWQPTSAAGGACEYSPSLDAIVLHGGLAPGRGRSADLCLGVRQRAAEVPAGARAQPAMPAMRWEKLAPNMVIPRRCFHGHALLHGSQRAGDRLLLFGGEGEAEDGAGEPSKMNDAWAIELPSGHATNLIPTSGTAPTPRTHLALAVKRDPTPPQTKRAAARLRKHGLGLVMAQRSGAPSATSTLAAARSGSSSRPASAGVGARGALKPSPLTAAVAVAGGGGTTAAKKGGAGTGAPLNLGGGDPDAPSSSWTCLVLGGRTGVKSGLAPEDALHVLQLTEGGAVCWTPSLVYLREATRQRLRGERVRQVAADLAARRPPSAERSERPEKVEAVDERLASRPRGSVAAAAAAAAAAEQLEAACVAGRAAFAQLLRHGHTSVVSGHVAIVFGGLREGRPTCDLLGVRFRDLAVSPLPATGAPPAERHAHAAALSTEGMLVCGGIEASRIFDDAHLLAIPGLHWSTIRLRGVPRAPPPARASGAARTPGAAHAFGPMARHAHGMASIGPSQLLVYGGYAAVSEKFGRAAVGGFAPNRAHVIDLAPPPPPPPSAAPAADDALGAAAEATAATAGGAYASEGPKPDASDASEAFFADGRSGGDATDRMAQRRRSSAATRADGEGADEWPWSSPLLVAQLSELHDAQLLEEALVGDVADLQRAVALARVEVGHSKTAREQVGREKSLSPG